MEVEELLEVLPSLNQVPKLSAANGKPQPTGTGGDQQVVASREGLGL